MRAFPVYESSYLADVVNQNEVIHQLKSIDRSSKTWRVTLHSDATWVEADESTKAGDYLQRAEKARKGYPLLNEHRYIEAEAKFIITAINRKAQDSKTIINSYMDAAAALLDAGIQIVEDGPRVFRVLCSDDTFKEVISEAFPHWNKEE